MPSSPSKPRAKQAVVTHGRTTPVYYDDDVEAREISTSLFAKLDCDGSGYLCIEELDRARDVMLCWCDDPNSARINDMIGNIDEEADEDDDGLIDSGEWHRFIKALYDILGRKQFLSIAKDWVADADSVAAPEFFSETAPRPASALGSGYPKAEPEATAPTEVIVGKSKSTSSKAPKAKIKKPAPTVVKKVSIAAEKSRPDSALKKADKVSPRPSVTTEEDAELVAAATKIQKMRRGSMARRKADEKKTEDPVTAVPSVFNPGVELRPTTIADLWDLLVISEGRIMTNVDLKDIVELFTACKRNGLDLALAATVRMHFDEKKEAEDLSPGEVAHMCTLIVENLNITEYEVRKELTSIKDLCRGGKKPPIGGIVGEAAFNLRQFRKYISLLSVLMQIDAQYIINQMAWEKTGRFELTDTLAVLVMDQCAHKGPQWQPGAQAGQGSLEADSPEVVWSRVLDGDGKPEQNDDTSVATLRDPFMMNDFIHLLYNTNLSDVQRRKGLDLACSQLLFQRVMSHLSELLQAHAALRKLKLPKAISVNSHGTVGRTEFEVLIVEFSKHEPINRMFPSPLALVVQMIQRAREQPQGVSAKPNIR